MKDNTINERMNMFMDLINQKRLVKGLFGKWKHIRKVRKFKKTIYKGSPSFALLWHFSDFIKLAEKVFFVENINNGCNGCYSSRNYKNEQNGFKITTTLVTITAKLFGDTEKIAIDVVYRKSDPEIVHQLVFKQEEWCSNHSVYDEMLLEELIKIINQHMINLFDECYDKR